MTGGEQTAGAGPSGPSRSSPGCRPTVSHDLDPKVCTRCKKRPRAARSTWCRTCHQAGKDRAQASIERQARAGMPIPWKNWKPGDPEWWKASGCYGPET